MHHAVRWILRVRRSKRRGQGKKAPAEKSQHILILRCSRLFLRAGGTRNSPIRRVKWPRNKVSSSRKHEKGAANPCPLLLTPARSGISLSPVSAGYFFHMPSSDGKAPTITMKKKTTGERSGNTSRDPFFSLLFVLLAVRMVVLTLFSMLSTSCVPLVLPQIPWSLPSRS